MFSIGKRFKFDAAHRLTTLPPNHKCSRLHGHTYHVTLTLEATRLDEHGFVLDYGDLAEFKTWVDDTLDHRYLNDVVPVSPTAENLARWLFDLWTTRIPLLAEVEVCETESTFARYRPATFGGSPSPGHLHGGAR